MMDIENSRRAAHLSINCNKIIPIVECRESIICDHRAHRQQRIAQRFRDMLEGGLVDEVRRLRARPGLSAGHASMRAVGYRQAWEYLDGEFDMDALVERGIASAARITGPSSTSSRSCCRSRWASAPA